MHARDLSEARTTYFRMMESVPVEAYLGAASASFGLSLLLRLLGKKDAAMFFGQWPTMFLLMPLVYRLLRPSTEDPTREGQEAIRQATQLITTPR